MCLASKSSSSYSSSVSGALRIHGQLRDITGHKSLNCCCSSPFHFIPRRIKRIHSVSDIVANNNNIMHITSTEHTWARNCTMSWIIAPISILRTLNFTINSFQTNDHLCQQIIKSQLPAMVKIKGKKNIYLTYLYFSLLIECSLLLNWYWKTPA